MDEDDIRQLLDSARLILRDTGKPVEHLVAELEDAGLHELVAEDPRLFCSLLYVQGQELGRSTLLDLVIAGSGYRSGRRAVLPMPGSRRPPAIMQGRSLVIDGLIMNSASDGISELLVHTGSGAYVVEFSSLTTTPVGGFDPALELGSVCCVVDEQNLTPTHARDWDDAVDAASSGLASEMLGVATAAFGMAVDAVSEREQFGRPLSALQSVRHQLAEAYVSLEGAKSVVGSADPTVDELKPMTAKLLAGRAAVQVLGTAQQLCGAMGFTKEFGLGELQRRALVLDSFFDGVDDTEISVGALLAARGTLPQPTGLVDVGRPCVM